jgi:hypothetical protein
MYLAQARRELSVRSYETVACILRRFEKACGHLPLTECRPFDLQSWLNDHPEYRSEWYIRCVIGTIKRAFNWGCEMELVPYAAGAAGCLAGCLWACDGPKLATHPVQCGLCFSCKTGLRRSLR